MGAADRAFSKRVAEKGWIGLSWPVEYGGQALGDIERAIYTEEMIGHPAPMAYHFISERQMGPTIIRHGNAEQKELVRKIMDAELAICIGMSEPGAGSDLASVTTSARIDGDDFIINGQKIWTSHAHQSDWIMLVTRTNQDVPKHKGISLIFVDLTSPGVTIRPLIDMGDVHGFNEIFFDDVRVPRKNLIGEQDAGWYILAENLDYERGGIERICFARWLLDDMLAHMKTADREPQARYQRLRTEIADRVIEYEVGRLLCYRVAWLFGSGRVPNHEASISKMFGSEWAQRCSQTAMRLLQAYGIGGKPEERELARKIQAAYLHCAAHSILGGTSEIQRNVIATRGLGLPR